MKPISAVAWAPNRIDVFALATDNSAQHIWFNGSAWSAWESLGGIFTTPIVAVSRGPNLLDLFGLGTDYAMFHRSWNGSVWSAWESLGGTFLSEPAAVATSSTSIELVGLGTDRSLFIRSFDAASGWTPAWQPVGGHFTSTPAIVSPDPTRIDIFAVDTSFAMQHISRKSGSWSPWLSLGGIFSSQPTAIAWLGTRSIVFEATSADSVSAASPGSHPAPQDRPAAPPVGISKNPLTEPRVTVFGLGTDNSLFCKTSVGGDTFPSDWLSLGGVLRGRVDVLSPGIDRLDVYGTSPDSGIYHRGFSGNWSSPWNGLSGSVTSPPVALLAGPAHTELLAVGADFSLVHLSSNNFNGWGSLGGRLILPGTFTFSLDSYEITDTRSRHNDTDFVAVTLTVGGHPPQTLFRKLGDVNNGTHTLDLVFTPVEVDLSNFVLFTYLILNYGNSSDDSQVQTNMVNISNALVQGGIQAAQQSMVTQSTAIAGAIFGTAILPVFGTILGILGGYILGTFLNIAFPDCDGPVAAEQAALSGVDLRRFTMSDSPVHRHTHHPGYPSPAGCGGNSAYNTTWTLKRID